METTLGELPIGAVYKYDGDGELRMKMGENPDGTIKVLRLSSICPTKMGSVALSGFDYDYTQVIWVFGWKCIEVKK